MSSTMFMVSCILEEGQMFGEECFYAEESGEPMLQKP